MMDSSESGIEIRRDSGDQAKKPTAVLCPPDELHFFGPFDRVNFNTLTIFNPSQERTLLFKIKSTFSNDCSVKPNMGIIKPGQGERCEIYVKPIQRACVDKWWSKQKLLIETIFLPSSDGERVTLVSELPAIQQLVSYNQLGISPHD